MELPLARIVDIPARHPVGALDNCAGLVCRDGETSLAAAHADAAFAAGEPCCNVASIRQRDQRAFAETLLARAMRRCDDRLRCVGTDRDPSEAHGKRENVGRDDSPLLSAIVARGVTSAQGPDPRERALCIASERPLSSSDIKKMTVFSQAGAADYPWSVGHRS